MSPNQLTDDEIRHLIAATARGLADASTNENTVRDSDGNKLGRRYLSSSAVICSTVSRLVELASALRNLESRK